MTFYPYWREPYWHSVNYRHHQLPLNIQQWLLDQGSLTQKLQERSAGDLRVQVLQQRIQRARLSEYRALGLDTRNWAVIREVILFGKGTPWVYARTVIPLSTLKGPLHHLYYLGNKPLGGELFKDPSMRRKSLELAPIETVHLPLTTPALKPVWGRRSLFLLKDKPLLVGEIFLENLLG